MSRQTSGMWRRRVAFTGMGLAAVMLAFGAAAATPRILYVGDSWTYYPWVLQSPPALREALAQPEYGLEDYEENGDLALATTAAEAWNTSDYKGLITAKLEEYPTLDIIHLSLGGNDLNSRWELGDDAETTQELLEDILSDIRGVVKHCLRIRPNVRVVIVGYDYINITEGFSYNSNWQVTGYDRGIEEAYALYSAPLPLGNLEQVLAIQEAVNALFIALEAGKLELALDMDRVRYVHSFGLMQHYYGLGTVNIPHDRIPPETVPLPQGITEGYANFPNGYTDRYSPKVAMAGQGVIDPLHLNADGYRILMRNAVEQAYVDWLGDSTPPEVVSIERAPDEEDAPNPNPAAAGWVSFIVRFSENVTGVDASDFVAVSDGGIEGAFVGLAQGSGREYRVVASTGTGSGTITVDLTDDDSIYDAAWNPLKGTRNGAFAGEQSYTVIDNAGLDQVAPLAICTLIELSLDENGKARISASDVDDGSVDTAGDVTTEIDNPSFDCSHIGENAVSLSVTDEAGNVSTCKAVVVVSDDTAPSITLNGQSTVLLLRGETYREQGAEATDNCEGGVEVEITGDVNTGKTGAYVVTYTAQDSSGNVARVTRTVEVEIPPLFGCNGG